jgi:hypothetical protein
VFSRRRFLQLAGAGVGAMIAAKQAQRARADHQPPPFPPDTTFNDTLLSANEYLGYPPLIGRVTANRLRIFDGPSPNANSIRNVYLHELLPIYAGVRGVGYPKYDKNLIWYYLGPNADGQDEYIHSAFVAPTREVFNEPEEASEEDWWWGQVTVPLTNQHTRPTVESVRWTWDYYRGYYTQMHKVVGVEYDEEGRHWYKIQDDVEPNRSAWMLGRTLRKVHRGEFAPINPDVQDKRLVIDLNQQLLSCYENGAPVFRTRLASGKAYTNEAGQVFDFSTQPGNYPVMGKRPSRRMRGGEQFDLAYDVNGVPWVTYFTTNGAAVHGAFWHNNYGMTRSHGCINVTADAARFVYLWSRPYVAYEHISGFQEAELDDGNATLFEVIA